jgi:hypothetical protein
MIFNRDSCVLLCMMVGLGIYLNLMLSRREWSVDLWIQESWWGMRSTSFLSGSHGATHEFHCKCYSNLSEQIGTWWLRNNIQTRGSVVAKSLCHKPESCAFETRWGKCIFSVYLILPVALGPELYSASTEMSTRSRKIMFLGSKGRPVSRADNITAICEPIVQIMWDFQHFTAL